MVKVRTCECCGRPIPDIGVVAELTRTQSQIVLVLDKAGRAGINIRRLVDELYGNDPQGGPLNAVSCVRTMRSKMAPVLEKHGMRITSERDGTWRLDANARPVTR